MVKFEFLLTLALLIPQFRLWVFDLVSSFSIRSPFTGEIRLFSIASESITLKATLDYSPALHMFSDSVLCDICFDETVLHEICIMLELNQ